MVEGATLMFDDKCYCQALGTAMSTVYFVQVRPGLDLQLNVHHIVEWILVYRVQKL